MSQSSLKGKTLLPGWLKGIGESMNKTYSFEERETWHSEGNLYIVVPNIK